MDAFTCSKTIHNEGFITWFNSISNICKLLNVSVTTEMVSDMSFKPFKKNIINVMLAKFKIFWADFRANNIDGKLRTYFSCKEHFEFEQYLNIIKNFDKRRQELHVRLHEIIAFLYIHTVST